MQHMKSLAKLKMYIDSNQNNANLSPFKDDRFTIRLELDIFAIGKKEL